MNAMARHIEYTVGEEWLAAYVAGSLSEAKSLVVACQAAIKPEVEKQIFELEFIGGMLMENASGADISADFFGRVMNALDEGQSSDEKLEREERARTEIWMPLPLQRYLEASNAKVKWRFAGPGVERAPLAETEDGERLYLLKARGGFAMPTHSHRGEEWTLILKGSYHVGDDRFTVGDLHREDQTCTHQPIVDEGEECICLVAIEGKLKFKEPLLRVLQPLFGV